MSGYEQFQISFEQHSEKAFNDLNKLTEEELLKIIENRFDLKYGIQRVTIHYYSK